ncbi:uncharacterized protein LOC133524428 isoform X2 [Cydia pomonella]|nr:uncharacterized protein LOC133524428 isoform X2 [Cydia pomonella]
MQEQNARFNTPTSNKTVAHRFSQSPDPPATFPMPSSPTSLRMIRHPVPTSKGRMSFADKLEQIVKVPKLIIPPKTTFQRSTGMPLIPGDIPPTKAPANDPEKNKTEESIIANILKTPAETCLLNSTSESPMPMKHKLPFTVVPHRGSYIKKTTNPLNKENTRTQAEKETQTEKCFIVTEEEIQILEIVKNSGLSSEEIQNYLVNCKKEKEKKSDEKIIDIEDDSEEDANDLYAKLMKHSTNNKFVLNKIAKILQKSNSSISTPLTPPNEPPSNPLSASTAPITAIGTPSEHFMPSPITAAGAVADTLKPAFNPQNLEANDLQKGFAVSAMLLQMGFRIVRIEPQTQGTQTEENRENNKRRKIQSNTNENHTVNELMGHYKQNVQRPPVVPILPSQELPAPVPQMQDMPVFQPHNSPHQQQPQQQPQQYASEHIERPAQYYPHMSSFIAHQRGQNTATRNPHLSSTAAHNPLEHNRNTNTFSTSQTPVQMQNQAQLYPNNQRRQSLVGQPHLSRVMSTREANMHGSQVQQACWGYTHYYDRQGYPQRHQ